MMHFASRHDAALPMMRRQRAMARAKESGAELPLPHAAMMMLIFDSFMFLRR